MTMETIRRAADDLNEALLLASDGTVRVNMETLTRVVMLLAHGTDAGEFFDGFRAAVTDRRTVPHTHAWEVPSWPIERAPGVLWQGVFECPCGKSVFLTDGRPVSAHGFGAVVRPGRVQRAD